MRPNAHNKKGNTMNSSIAKADTSPFFMPVSSQSVFGIDATDGTETIAQASAVFDRISPSFDRLGTNVKDKPTEKRDVVLHKLIKAGYFVEMLLRSENEQEKFSLTQSQIVQFVRKYPELFPVRKFQHTFFLTKTFDKFFVVNVSSHYESEDGGLGTSITPLLDSFHLDVASQGQWNYDQNRFVFPELVH